MKVLFFVMALLFQFNLFAQETLFVQGKQIDLGIVHETLGNSVKKVLLEINQDTDHEFKVKFDYKYRFVSHELETVTITPSGFGGYTTRQIIQDYTGKQTLRFDIGESSVVRGEKILVLLEISKPNKNIHGIKVEAKLLNNETNSIEGGKKLLGLLGRSYTIKENCPE